MPQCRQQWDIFCSSNPKGWNNSATGFVTCAPDGAIYNIGMRNNTAIWNIVTFTLILPNFFVLFNEWPGIELLSRMKRIKGYLVVFPALGLKK